jgi:hypothetical protein
MTRSDIADQALLKLARRAERLRTASILIGVIACAAWIARWAA